MKEDVYVVESVSRWKREKDKKGEWQRQRRNQIPPISYSHSCSLQEPVLYTERKNNMAYVSGHDAYVLLPRWDLLHLQK